MPRVSQVGTAGATLQRLEVFMTNNPSASTHWLSQIRLNMQVRSQIRSLVGSGDMMKQVL